MGKERLVVSCQYVHARVPFLENDLVFRAPNTTGKTLMPQSLPIQGSTSYYVQQSLRNDFTYQRAI